MYSVLLDNELLKLYYNFRTHKDVDVNLVQKFLSLYQPVFLATKKQLEAVGYWEHIVDNESSVAQQILGSNLDSLSEEDLLSKTKYKIRLTVSSDNYPNISIINGKLRKDFSMFFSVGEQRAKAIKIIKALCRNVSNIYVCDRYMLLQENHSTTKSLFRDLYKENPNANLYYELCRSPKNALNTAEQQCMSYLKNNFNVIKGNIASYKHSHDRYIVLDNKLEIVLSSGIEGLYSADKKEITVIFREK